MGVSGWLAGSFWCNMDKFVQFREDLPFLFNRLKFETGLLIGVQRGEFAEYLLEFWKGKKLYAFDSWRDGQEGSYKGNHNIQRDNLAKTFMTVYGAKEKVVLVRENLKDISFLFMKNTLDFVILDMQFTEKNIFGIFSKKEIPLSFQFLRHQQKGIIFFCRRNAGKNS